MQKFIGKASAGDADTNSEMTSVTKQTKGSSKQLEKQPRNGSPGIDELDEAATMQEGERDEYEAGNRDTAGDEEDAI